MTETEITRQIALRAATVARRSPDEWSALLEALTLLSNHRRDECVSSPVDTLFVAQGRARESASLLRMLETCLKTADQITEKRK